MTAVMMTPPYIQFFDSDGVTPLNGGKVYTYTSTGGTFATAKATYTDATGATPAANPVILNARGIPTSGNGNLWLSGTYDFKVTDSAGVQVGQQLAVTAFTALAASSTAYFQSFSGTGAQTAFTTSSDLGTDEKAIFVWVDAGAGKGYEIYNPSAYTISGTTLTFSVAPASGTNNIYVSSPSTLVGAASSSAADAAASAAAAAASETAAATAETNAETAETNAETAETNAAASAAAAAVSVDWATKTNGLVAATDYSSKAWAIGGTGTTTNNAKYYSEQAAAIVTGDILIMTEQGSTPSTPVSGDSKLYFDTDGKLRTLDDAGTVLIVVAPSGFGTLGQAIISAGSGATPTWGTASNLVLLNTQDASTSSTIDFTSTYITSTYKQYLIEVIQARPATDTARLTVRLSQSATFRATSGDYDFNYFIGSRQTALARTGDATSTAITLGGACGNLAAEGTSCWIRLYDPTASAGYKKLLWNAVNIEGGGIIETTIGSASFTLNETALDGIRFVFDSGNITSGRFKLYGVV